jgi:hypothetical protein
MQSRRELLCVAGAMVLLPALAACSRPHVKLEWVERWFRDHPAVASVNLNFDEGHFFWQAPRLATGLVRLKPNLPADQVVAFTRYVTELIHSSDTPRLSGQLEISDPGYEGNSPPRYGGDFTFPDFSESQPVEIVEAAARHWLDTATKYQVCRVGFDGADASRVYTDVEIDDNAAPAALATAFGDFAHHKLPNSVTTSWSVEIPDPRAWDGTPDASLWSSYSTEDGLPPDAVLQAMMSLATLNMQLNQFQQAELHAYWHSAERRYLNVWMTLRPRELHDLPSDKIDSAIPGSTAPRTANMVVELLENAGIPYKLDVYVRDRRPVLTLERTNK